MKQTLVSRRGAKRVILWDRACARGLETVAVVFVLFLIATCAVGAANEGHFFDTWWGQHLLLLLLAFLFGPFVLGAIVPLLRAWRLPLDQLTDLDAADRAASAEASQGRRIRRGPLVAAILLFALPLAITFFYVEENERGERAWRKYQERQEAQGESLDVAKLVPPPLPDAENFAATPFLRPLFDYLPGTQQLRDPGALAFAQGFSPQYEAASSRMHPESPGRLNSWTVTETDLLAWQAAFANRATANTDDDSANRAFLKRYGVEAPPAGAPAATPPPTEQEFTNRTEAAAAILAALSECDDVLEELRTASRRPGSRFNLNYGSDNPGVILLPHLSVLKRVCQVLQLRASAELALGRTDAAAEDIQMMFRVCDANRSEPILICQFVRLTELQLALQPLAEGLAEHQWTEPQLRTLQERLSQLDFLADGRRAFQGERTFFGSAQIDYVRRSPDRRQAWEGALSGGDQVIHWQSLLLSAMPAGWLYLEKLNYNRLFQEHIMPLINLRTRRVEPAQCRKAEADIGALVQRPAAVLVLQHRFCAGVMLPSLTGAVRKFTFAQTAVDAAAVACALERYRLAHGSLPESLDALVPKFIAQLPHDLITGQPLKYHRTPDNSQYVLYSVGWNEADDGGVLGWKDSGKRVDTEQGDWVWCLPSAP